MRAKLLSAFVKACQPFIKIGVNRISGVRAAYHLLHELLWLWPMKSVIEVEGSKMYVNPHVKGPLRTTFRAYVRHGDCEEPCTTQ